MALGWKLHGDGKTDAVPTTSSPRTSGCRGARRSGSAPSTSSRCSARPSSSRSSWASTPARDHDERHRDDLLPAHRQRARCRATSAPRRRSSAASRRSAPRAATPPTVTGAILVAGARARRSSACSSTSLGVARCCTRCCRRSVTGAVVMLIGFNLAPVVAGIYWPQDQWVALLVMTFVDRLRGRLRGLLGRIAVFLAPDLRLRPVVALRQGLRPDHRPATRGAGKVTTHFRTNFDATSSAAAGSASRRDDDRRRRQGGRRLHAPSFSMAAILLVLPGRHRADRREHRPRQGRRRDDRRRTSTPTWAAPSPPTASAPSSPRAVGGSPTTTYAENIGVMAATRVYSTAAYYVAAVVAILLRPLARSSAPSSPRCRAACSAASPSSSTA